MFASIDYGLTANVDNLVLQGGADLQGFGNGEVNAIIGNSGNNILDGGAGADAMTGGAGNDAYIVDNAGDRWSRTLAKVTIPSSPRSITRSPRTWRI